MENEPMVSREAESDVRDEPQAPYAALVVRLIQEANGYNAVPSNPRLALETYKQEHHERWLFLTENYPKLNAWIEEKSQSTQPTFEHIAILHLARKDELDRMEKSLQPQALQSLEGFKQEQLIDEMPSYKAIRREYPALIRLLEAHPQAEIEAEVFQLLESGVFNRMENSISEALYSIFRINPYLYLDDGRSVSDWWENEDIEEKTLIH